ncbi:MAG: nitroreductase family protein [Deltaproteobacteria bacterium]
MRRSFFLGPIALFAVSSVVFAKDAIRLPSPRTEGGKPLMQALKERRSQRSFSPKVLPDQVLSDLLWAADGINRPDGHKTAPSARNMQEIDIYVAKADGLYLYGAKDNSLSQVTAEDIRALTGKQDFVKSAPVDLIYVADEGRMSQAGELKDKWASADTGFIAENVYLYCASEGLATVVRGMFDEAQLSKAMKLRPNQKIVLTQTVGYPQ